CHEGPAPVATSAAATAPPSAAPRAGAPPASTPPASAPDAAVSPVASVPSSLPTPESVWGFAPGQDYRLATYDQSIAYFKKLAAASRNIQLFEAGKSSEGRTFYFAAISTTENLAKLDRYREIAQRIAHPEGLTDDEAHALAREGKVILHIDGGLHASESAGPQHTPLLAYDILRQANTPDMHAELENVILLLWPTINPDGQQMVAEYANANQGRQFPGLYQAYVGHDNNRDAYMLNMIESRVMEHTWRQWEPDIIHVHHQGAPAPSRIWFPPFAEPIATWAPPLMSREVNVIGTAMARAEDEVGHVGSSHMGRPYDAWYPGYIDYNPMFKNIVAYWTETAANGGGGGGRAGGRGGAAGEPERPQSLYSSPWTPGSPWNLRTAIEYMETASLAVLDFAAKYKESIIYDRYQSGRDQIARGRAEAPYAYVVPQDQPDPVAPVELLRRLAFSGVRVSQLTASAEIDGTSYPAGTWVVPTDQEFAAVAREVLDVQKYPEVRPAGPNGPLDQPYDAAGWTLPMTMRVTVAAAATPLAAATRAKLKVLGPMPDPKVKPTPYNMTDSGYAAPFDSVPGIGFNSNANAAALVPESLPLAGSGQTLAIDAAQNNAFRAVNRAWKAGLS
ncbi:MAG TPA: M14 family zinc carboxypeptidase, partial [Vicinamibacterales bacterium]